MSNNINNLNQFFDLRFYYAMFARSYDSVSKFSFSSSIHLISSAYTSTRVLDLSILTFLLPYIYKNFSLSSQLLIIRIVNERILDFEDVVEIKHSISLIEIKISLIY